MRRSTGAWWAEDGFPLTPHDARLGCTYRVGRIVFGLVCDAFRDLGIEEGSLLRVEARTEDELVVTVNDTSEAVISLEYGAFVPLAKVAAPSSTTPTGPKRV